MVVLGLTYRNHFLKTIWWYTIAIIIVEKSNYYNIKVFYGYI